MHNYYTFSIYILKELKITSYIFTKPIHFVPKLLTFCKNVTSHSLTFLKTNTLRLKITLEKCIGFEKM
jgi:hypothetical protein